ncbi:hypothetical protein [Oharaeibacter diazotrophicus]|uniref:Uncharacterized protein n=1 Tax=Oharaeibacter diazotrophicus TaxID=1920512 RepID=A0A4R6R7P1_9HYPH|nr:hypothetical protein [Oharaeibacter diazotrophicus]TDP81993.1 hypothetical protein EDD54_4254 [Oharaeibacter diazotrophicus]BBE73625.1 hypothetical protein OHA_1_03239 [Pleomorphomonas sp. SM30]GLS75414.1 hypothetical protein GCM10007904_07490 [Oharaeibacter diazotrophicus]
MIRVAADTLPHELLALIAKVEAGDVVLLERNGVVIARIEPPAAMAIPSGDTVADTSTPAEPIEPAVVDAAAESPLARELRELRKGVTLGGLDWKALRDEGRR